MLSFLPLRFFETFRRWVSLAVSFINLLIVGAGGFVGTVLRFLVVKSIDQRLLGTFPLATLVVNISGSFLIGLIYGVTAKDPAGSQTWRLFLATGICGGYTTFSAFSMENLTLLEQRLALTSILYMTLSIVLGVGAAMIGVIAGKSIRP